ncbi:MAG: hypothetical protein J3R72DRAFT_5475 [Linnemannia gamsii]|nr:MAG: hypothetical protein J3R72DRAFT_5475 [Linnemannia gamsii]
MHLLFICATYMSIFITASHFFTMSFLLATVYPFNVKLPSVRLVQHCCGESRNAFGVYSQQFNDGESPIGQVPEHPTLSYYRWRGTYENRMQLRQSYYTFFRGALRV